MSVEERGIVTILTLDIYEASQERKKAAKATPIRVVNEETARPLAPPVFEELPVLEGLDPEEVLVPLGPLETPEEERDVLTVGRAA